MRKTPSTLCVLLLMAALASTLAACGSSPAPPFTGARGSIYDRNGVRLAYSERDSNAPGGFRRHYCVPSLSPLLGYFSTGNETGIEKAYDSQLGQGNDLYLTIDWRVQNLIDKQFDITFDNPGDTLSPPFIKLPQGISMALAPGDYGPLCDKNVESQLYNPPPETAAHYHPGSAIVSDPHTGEILGMLSRPYFNAEKIGDPTAGAAYFQQISHDPLSPLLNRPTSGLYAPGATLQTITLAAALDSGKYHLSDPFGGNNCLDQNSEARSYTVNGRTFSDIYLRLYNPPPACPIDLEHGYVYGDDIISARVGVGLGADTWLDYAQRFGVTDANNRKAFPFDFPVESSRVVFQGSNGVQGQDHQVDLAVSAFGQGTVQVTPLTMSFIASTIANNGVALRPHLLYKVVPHGTAAKDTTVTPPAPYTGLNGNFPNGQIISPQTASQIREAMLGVVKQGSAFTITGSRANVGGKTGTAQLGGNLDPHSWFISLAPDIPGQAPQYAVTVMRENGDEGLLQAGVADCIYLSLLPGIGNPPLQNIHDGTNYPRYRCAP